MSRKRSRNKVGYRKSISFIIHDKSQRDLFLNNSFKILKPYDVIMDSKLERIKITLEGSKAQIDNVSEKLILLEQNLRFASTPDRDGYYQVDQNLLHTMYPIHLSVNFLSNLLYVFDFDSYSKDLTLFTKASFPQVQKLYENASRALKNSLSEQNRDVQRFLSIFEVKTNTDQILLLQHAVEYGILHEIDGQYKFKIDFHDALDRMYANLGSLIKPKTRIELSDAEDLDYLKEFAFDGGKMIFVQDGEELEHSPFDIKNKTED